MTVSALKTIDLTIAGPEDYEGLHSLTSFIFPNEFNGKLEVEALDQGLSNQLLRIRYGTGTSKPRVFLVRIYGETTNAMVDRSFEILCMNAFNQHHSSQKLHAIFRNGISYSYVDGFTLPVSHMGTEKYARLIGDELAHFHSLPIETILRQPGLRDALFVHAGRAQTIPTLFPRLRDWISGLPADLPNPQESVLYQTRFPTPEQLLCEVEFLEKLLHDPCSPVVLCHGDLLSGNIIVSPDKSSVTFIDLEFCGFNHAAFDIGNHFCEYAGIGNVDYSKYPSPSFQREWIKFYLKCLRKYRSMAVNNQSDHGDDEDPDDQEVNKWIREVGYFALAAHLHWGIWAAIRAKDGLSGFDYLAYAIKRLDQYYLMKKRILHADGLTQ